MKLSLSQSILLLTSFSTFFLGTRGSERHVADDAFLRSAVYKSIRSKCPSKGLQDKLSSLRWGLKERMKQAGAYIHNNGLSEDQFKPDPNLVEAYAEYFCKTMKFPSHGKLPPINVLEYQQLNYPAQEVRRKF